MTESVKQRAVFTLCACTFQTLYRKRKEVFTMKVRLLLIGMAAFLLLPLRASAYEASRVEEKTFRLSSGGSIRLEGGDGYVSIRSWDKEEVFLRMTFRAWGTNRRKAEARLQDIGVDVRHDRNWLEIREFDRKRHRRFHIFDIFTSEFWEGEWRGTQINYELQVPKKVNLTIETDEGDVEIQEVRGSFRITTDEGNVELNSCASPEIEISSDEGDVTLTRLKGAKKGLRLYVEIDEGRLRIREAELQRLIVRGDEGDVLLAEISCSDLDVDVDEGDVEATLNLKGDFLCSIYADEGDVLLTVPRNLDAFVRLRALEGRVRSDFDLERIERAEGSEWRGQLRKGRGKLEVRTDEGDIILEKR